MKAVRGNKEYSIDESQQKSYQDAGFDIVDGGKVIAYGRGKTVSYDDYAAAIRDIADLTDKVAELQDELAQKGSAQEEKKAAKKAGE